MKQPYGPADLAYMNKRNASSTRGRANMLLQAAKSRARKRDLPFNLTMDWVEDRIIAGHCAATGVPFEMAMKSPYAPSIDQRNAAEGYTQENCRLVTWFYNRAKGSNTDEETMSAMRRSLNL